jgi:phenylalanine-4-hydroxylase
LFIPAFLQVHDILRLSKPGIPDFDELNERLRRATGWTVAAAPGLVPDAVFFEHLAKRRCAARRFIRTPQQIDCSAERTAGFRKRQSGPECPVVGLHV